MTLLTFSSEIPPIAYGCASSALKTLGVNGVLHVMSLDSITENSVQCAKRLWIYMCITRPTLGSVSSLLISLLFFVSFVILYSIILFIKQKADEGMWSGTVDASTLLMMQTDIDLFKETEASTETLR